MRKKMKRLSQQEEMTLFFCRESAFSLIVDLPKLHKAITARGWGDYCLPEATEQLKQLLVMLETMEKANLKCKEEANED